MSEVAGTRDYPPEMLAALEELYKVMVILPERQEASIANLSRFEFSPYDT